MSSVESGLIAEYQAAEFLKNLGYKILEVNVNFHKVGEIDIVAMDAKTLVIVEVKYRSKKDLGLPLEAVTVSKIKKILKATERYIYQNSLYNLDVRFDVIGILDGKIEHVKNAFYGYWH